MFRYEEASGRLKEVGATEAVARPSFVMPHSDGPYLYAVGERTPGSVWAIHYDGTTGTFTPLNQQTCGGDGPCHLTLDRAGRWLFVANYVSGSLGLLPVNEDGTLGPLADSAQHSGRGPDTERQDGPHTHSTKLSPDERFVIAADLGADKLYTYAFDRGNGKVTPRHETGSRPGAGPRHMVFHPNGDLLYVANELDNTVASYRYDEQVGSLAERQVIGTLPPGAPATTTADIHITSAGDRLYVSNRGHDSIAAYDVGEDGELALIDIRPCGGRTPRNFALSADERFLLVANQESNDVVVFPIEEDGAIGREPVERVRAGGPTCVKFEQVVFEA
jgi:6-phosphogluconolactonase